MEKALVFISHITEEREVAIAFKELVEEKFLGMINVFVSSDEHDISMGAKWLDEITESLKSCAIEVVLCSPESIKRPWINFEAGAGWIRAIPVIPLCHSGIVPTKLPLPLNLLQGARATEITDLRNIFPVVAKAIGANAPEVDFTRFIEKVKEFEKRYTFWNACNAAFTEINRVDARILPALRSHATVTTDLTETQIAILEKAVSFLTRFEVLRFQRTGGLTMTNRGALHSCEFVALPNLTNIFSDHNFRPA